jgi:hypothetical protein
MEDVGKLPHVETRTDSKGRKQPSKKSEPTELDALRERAASLERPRGFYAKYLDELIERNQPSETLLRTSSMTMRIGRCAGKTKHRRDCRHCLSARRHKRRSR